MKKLQILLFILFITTNVHAGRINVSNIGPTSLSELSDINTATPTYGHLLVADGTDWDSIGVLYVDSTLNRVGVGGSKTQVPINGATTSGKVVVVVDDGNPLQAELAIARHENTTAGVGVAMYGARSRGTAASPTVVQDDDSLYQLYGIGFDGTDYSLSSSINFVIDGIPGANDMPGRIEFKTSADGAQSPTVEMVIKNDGKIGIGTATPGAELNVIGAIAVGTTAPSASFRGEGDIYATSGIKAMEGLFSEAGAYGAGVEVLDNDLTVTYTNVMFGDATITAASKIITDTHASFTDSYEGQFLRVISSTPSFTGATGKIIEVLSGTQIILSFGTAGTDTIVDATDASFVIYPHPRFFVGDNGAISASIGPNEDAKFEIHIDEGNGFHGVYIDDTAGADQHQAFTVDTNTATSDGVVGANVFMFSNTATTTVSTSAISLEINANNYTDSHLSFIDVSGIGSGTDNDIDIIHIEGLDATDHIIHIGQPNTIERAYYDEADGTAMVDVTSDFTTQGAGNNATLFENDNSIVYIANETEEFTFVGVDLATDGRRNINAEYYYCTGDNTWVTLSSVIDTTNGFKTSGSISFPNPGDRGLCDEEMDSTAFADTTDRAYIAIKRTRDNFNGDRPVENLFTISGTNYAYMDSYGFKRMPSAGAPYACGASAAGMIYFDSSDTHFYGCDGSSWDQLDN